MIRSLSGKLITAFSFAVLILIVNGVISYRSVTMLRANNELVIHTQEVIDGLQDLQTSLIQAETDARGFIITGDRIYLDAYNTGRGQIPGRVDALKRLTSDNASHQLKFPVLETAVASRLELLEAYVHRREQVGLESVVQAGQGSEGKRRMDAVRAAIDSIAADERGLLASRVADSRTSANNTQATFVIANTFLLALFVAVFYLAIRDIRERRVNEAALQAARDQLELRVVERTAALNNANTELEQSNRELQDFAFVASHDLQEPLRKIQAFGDRLSTKHGAELNDEARDYLGRMLNAATRMHTLINDLLSFSRVTTKAQPFASTDLNRVAREVLSDLEVSLEDNRARVEVGSLPTIDADALQMRQLLQNLIGNAVKFHAPDVSPVINISAETLNGDESGTFRLLVADNGIGFDEKYLDRIFTPFQRLHGRGEYEGTGIGLAVCRKIVERHGGTLTAKSKPGEGSTFVATMPLKQKGYESTE